MRGETRSDRSCCQRVFLQDLGNEGLLLASDGPKLHAPNESWGGFAAHPIFAAEFSAQDQPVPFLDEQASDPGFSQNASSFRALL
jgi:hypothetical protein